MKYPLTLACLACAAIGAGSALATMAAFARRPDTGGAAGPVVAPPTDDTSAAGLGHRLEELVSQNQDILLRLGTLEDRLRSGESGSAPRERRVPQEDFVSRSEFESFEQEVRAALIGRTAASPGSESWKEQVTGLLVDLQHEEQVTAIRSYQDKREDRLDSDLEKLTETLGLNGYQATEMRGVLASQYEREQEQLRLWEEGGDETVLAEQKGEDSDRFREDLQRVLSPEQLDSFWNSVGAGGKR